MISSALLSTMHLFALAIGLPSVFLRGRALRAVPRDGVAKVLAADNVWGVAAVLWLVTGLLRAFGPFEKGSAYYLATPAFLVKMGLFIGIIALELWPMITFIQWRIRQSKGLPLDTSRAATLARVNDLELALTVLMPFFASLMARGLWVT